VEIISSIATSEKITGIPQEENQATYSLWRDEADYIIDWKRDSLYIKRFIDSVGFPYKGAATFVEDKLVRILEATAIDDLTIENRTPGKVLLLRDGKPIVVCGEGLLLLDHVVDDTTNERYKFNRVRIRFQNRRLA